MNFAVEFHYDGFVLPAEKRLVERAYMIMRNEAVELINPHLEEWNNEYGTIEDQDDYNRFIAKKEQKILNDVNRRLKGSPVTLMAREEDGDIVGVFTEAMTKRQRTMFMTLKPIEK